MRFGSSRSWSTVRSRGRSPPNCTPISRAAYDAAQDRAATQIIGWLAQHATTRVGPRGAQVQVPVTEIEAVTVRHYTSRAGDPHRHLHLQINARVFAEGTLAGPAHGRRAGLARRDQRHRARRRDDRPGVPGGARRARLHPRPRHRRGRAAGRVRRSVQRPRGADRRATSTATRPSGAPPTRVRSRARRCGGRGTRAPGPTPARTRSCPATARN